MYTPTGTSKSTRPPIRAAVVGAPGSGKTHFALSFPNPYVVDFDHNSLPGIDSAPFWQDEFVDNLFKEQQKAPRKGTLFTASNKRDALIYWSNKHITSFAEDQTLIYDSWSMIQGAYDQQAEFEIQRPWSKDAGYTFWREKASFSKALCEILKRAKCMIVVTVHEVRETDADNHVTDKIKPFQQGGFAAEFLGHFTDVMRAVVDPPDPTLKNPNDPYALLSRKGNFLQLISDKHFDCKLNPAMNDTVRASNLKFIPNEYKDFVALLTKTFSQ